MLSSYSGEPCVFCGTVGDTESHWFFDGKLISGCWECYLEMHALEYDVNTGEATRVEK